MSASRWSNGRNADFIALMVTHRRSATVQSASAASRAASRDSEVPLISRLSVLRVTRNFSRARSEIGWSPMDFAAPVCRLLLGHISSGILASRTYAARSPKYTELGSNPPGS